MGGGELLGPERGHRRFAVAPAALPYGLGSGAAGDGGPGGHGTRRPVDARSGSDPGDELVDGSRLAIRHDESPTADSGEGIERSEQ